MKHISYPKWGILFCNAQSAFLAESAIFGSLSGDYMCAPEHVSCKPTTAIVSYVEMNHSNKKIPLAHRNDDEYSYIYTDIFDWIPTCDWDLPPKQDSYYEKDEHIPQLCHECIYPFDMTTSCRFLSSQDLHRKKFPLDSFCPSVYDWRAYLGSYALWFEEKLIARRANFSRGCLLKIGTNVYLSTISSLLMCWLLFHKQNDMECSLLRLLL